MKAAVIGGGIFGLYCADVLLENNFKVDVYEQGNSLCLGASQVNQARLHLGYHYPRSKETALQCIKGFYDFQYKFPKAINKSFKQYYAISSTGSKVTDKEYLRFCDELKLPYKIVKLPPDIIRPGTVKVVIEALEYAFDWKEVVNSLEEKIINNGGKILLNHKIIDGDVKGKVKKLVSLHRDRKNIENYDIVINAAYANINGLNKLFGLPLEPLSFEMCEMVKILLPQKYNSIGVTIMDGNFTSVMPFGLTGYQTIHNVRKTPHERSDVGYPIFSCNKEKNNKCKCDPNNINICLDCKCRFKSGYESIKEFAVKYLPYVENAKFIDSMFAVKTILNYVEDSDARPSMLIQYDEAENYYVVFGGKINTIIDIGEKLIKLIKN